MKRTFTVFALLLAAAAGTAQVSPCTNSDFELSAPAAITGSAQVTGWIVMRGASTGTNNNCNLLGCCPQLPSGSGLISTSATAGYMDPHIGPVYPIYSVFGTGTVNSAVATSTNPQLGFTLMGDRVIRVNNSNGGSFGVERASKTITVDSSNYLFEVAYMAVLSPGHGLCDAPAFLISINGSSCQPVGLSAGNPSTTNNFFVAGTGAPFTPTTFATYIFSKWDVVGIDLTPYLNQNVTIDITAAHCTAGGHFGYGYADARCGSATMQLNGNTVNVGPLVATLAPCSGTANITAPPYYNSFNWNGPSGFTSTLASITATAAGNYTLTVTQGCSTITKTITVAMPQPLVLTGPTTSVAAGSTVVLTAGGASTYTWSTGANGPSATVTPVSGTNTYSVNATDNNGCPVSGTISIQAAVTSGLAENSSATSMRLFPNPARGVLHVDVRSSGTRETIEAVVTDLQGRMVLTGTIKSRGETMIDISSLARGLYILEARHEGTTVRKSFVVE